MSELIAMNGGAKPLVLDESVIKLAFEEYRERERAFLLGLTEKEKFVLDGAARKRKSAAQLGILEKSMGRALDIDDPRRYQRKINKPIWHFAVHYRFHVQVLMTLAGVQPVTLFFHPTFAGRSILARMAKECMNPVIQKYSLEGYGFLLDTIDQPLSYLSTQSYQGAAVFANKAGFQDVFKEDVQDVLFSCRILSREEKDRVLGTPFWYTGAMGAVRYKDVTETAKLWEAVVEKSGANKEEFFATGVQVVRYSLGAEDFQASLEHFNKWSAAAASVGVTIELDTHLHIPFKAFVQERKREAVVEVAESGANE